MQGPQFHDGLELRGSTFRPHRLLPAGTVSALEEIRWVDLDMKKIETVPSTSIPMLDSFNRGNNWPNNRTSYVNWLVNTCRCPLQIKITASKTAGVPWISPSETWASPPSWNRNIWLRRGWTSCPAWRTSPTSWNPDRQGSTRLWDGSTPGWRGR